MKNTLTKKIIIMSRYMILGTFLQCIFLSLLLADNTVAQRKSIDEIYVTLSVKKPVTEVFNAIEHQTNLKFTYNHIKVDENMVIEINANRLSLREVLEEISKSTQLTFRRVNENVHVSKANRRDMAVLEFLQEEQMITITGRVTSSDSPEGLPGANVVVKGTSQGTVTDLSGNYTIDVPGTQSVLVYSSVGYLSEEVLVGNRSVIDIVLTADITSLDELVVVGYGTQRRADLTGSISSVDTKEMKKLSARRVEEMLQGRAAGVMVSRSQGSPGSASSIHIRGVGSIGDTQPLWIVDGIRMDPGNHLNPNDIESIEILKDASSAAIFGAQAAHGVVLVTTKRGTKKEKVSVNVSSSVGQRSPVRLPNMLNREQFVDVMTRGRAAAGQAPEPEWFSMTHDTDWVGEMFNGSGIEQIHNVEISGGGENSNFYVSGGYEKEDGIMINNSFERYSLRVNSDFSIGKRLTVGQTFYASRAIENPTAEDGRDLESIFRGLPIHPLYTPSNPYGGWGIGPLYFNAVNPVAVQYQNIRNNINNRLNGNVFADVEILKGLNFRTTAGANILAGRTEHFQEAFNYGTLNNPISRFTMGSNDMMDYTTNLVLTYVKSINDHKFSAMVGYEAFSVESVNFSASAQNYPVQNSRSFALATGAIDIPNRNTLFTRRLVSQFSRVTYNYKDKYLFAANVRRDGSSRFGPINRFGVFPSFSAGYNIGNEDFMQNIAGISSLKFRGSWGILGSDNLQDFLFARTYSNERSTYLFDSQGIQGGTRQRGFFLRRFPNEEVKWEEVRQLDIGFDLGLLDNKLMFTADYYVKTTTDMLMRVQLPLSAGISVERSFPESPSINIGEVQNRGLEMALSYSDNIGDLSFNIMGNVSFNRNEVLRLNQDDFIPSGGGGVAFTGFNISRTQVGRPIGSFFGWEVDGIFQSDSEVQQLNDNVVNGNFQESQTTAGDFRYRDLDGDGRITTADMTYIGNPWPKAIYGLNLSANYKGFDFTLFLQGVYGVDIFNANKAYYRGMYSNYNMTTEIFQAWTAERPTAHPRMITTDPNGNFRKPSSYFVEDGSYLKFRNFQLGYSFGQPVLDALKISNLRVFVNAQNFITLTSYEWLDPELAGNNLNRGIDGQGQYPQTMLLSTGIQFGF